MLDNENTMVKVNLNTMDSVVSFVKTLSSFDGHFDLIKGHYMVDAKSLLGIFSMNERECVNLRIMDPHDDMNDVMNALQPYLVTAK